MKKIGLYIRHTLSPEKQKIFEEIIDFLHSLQKDIFVTTRGQIILSKKKIPFSVIEKVSDLDLLIFFGGDGTLLNAIQNFNKEDFSTPVFGINGGNLGFFSSSSPNDLKNSLNEIFDGEYKRDERMILSGKVMIQNQAIKYFHALNECSLHNIGVARLQKISTCVENIPLTTYRSDGLIISTPSGSTAYNIAAGGPIVATKINAIVITPLAPASFGQKPIVIPSENTLSLKTENNMSLSIDGQKVFIVTPDQEINITQSEQKVVFLRRVNENYYQNIKEKLGWGD